MENISDQIKDLASRFQELKAVLSLKEKQAELKELRVKMSATDFWQDQPQAAKVSQAAERLSVELKRWNDLETEIVDTQQMLALINPAGDEALSAELTEKSQKLEEAFTELEFVSLLGDKYDSYSAILAVHAGTGGVDAQDWAQILERMYLRFAEVKQWRAEVLDKNYGQEAGLKSVVLRLKGTFAYGYLKSENGVHRLLRNSPFDADGLRHTSFALVEVIPEIEEGGEVIIKDEDIRIDVFRSSGPGGQSVNTTDSAVRIVHLPSGLTVSCQSERSQKQNKENALKILKSRLYQAALEAKETEERQLRGELQKAEWGKQIRSYFLYGSRLIKDHRSQYETSNIEAVLDGRLEPFIEAYLRWRKQLK